MRSLTVFLRNTGQAPLLFLGRASPFPPPTVAPLEGSFPDRARRGKAAAEKGVLAANEMHRLATQVESGAVNLVAPATVDPSTTPERWRFNSTRRSSAPRAWAQAAERAEDPTSSGTTPTSGAWALAAAIRAALEPVAVLRARAGAA